MKMYPLVILKSDMSAALDSMVFAAKMCYGKENTVLSEEEKTALIRRILKVKHFSILEHAHVTFYISNVSRNFTHQLVRHRHMSFAQQSFHYTLAKDQQTPTYPGITTHQEYVMNDAFKKAFDTYFDLLNTGMPKEEARHVLPSGIFTKIVATANIREWMQFVNIRTCSVNCFEIREVATRIREHLIEHIPFMESILGPNCLVANGCTEGIKCCGKPWRLP